MKKFMLFLGILTAGVAIAWACSGDCKSCHPTLNLETDIRHSAMNECKICHTPESLAAINMGDTCGRDCFACHDAKAVLSNKNAHGMIQSCMNCHAGLAKSPLDSGGNIFQNGVKAFGF